MNYFATALVVLLCITQPSGATNRHLKNLVTLPLCEKILQIPHAKEDFLIHMQTVYKPRVKQQGIDLKTLGEALGLSSSAISKMFSGDYTPNFVQVLLMIYTLNLTYEEAFPANWYQSATNNSRRDADRPTPQIVPLPPDAEKFISLELFTRVHNLLLHADLDRGLSTQKVALSIQITQALKNDNTVSDETLYATVITYLYRLVDTSRVPTL